MIIAMIPPMICAPNIAAIPVSAAIACILATYAKLVPIITGNPAPMRKPFFGPIGNSCKNVESAETTSAD